MSKFVQCCFLRMLYLELRSVSASVPLFPIAHFNAVRYKVLKMISIFIMK